MAGVRIDRGCSVGAGLAALVSFLLVAVPCTYCQGPAFPQEPPPRAGATPPAVVRPPAAAAMPSPTPHASQPQDPFQAADQVADVRVVGLKQISLEKILTYVKTRPGRPYNAGLIEEDVRRLNGTKMFVSVKPYTQRTADGWVVIYEVLERPVLHYVKYVGNEKIHKKKLGEEAKVKPGDPMDPYAVEEARRRIEDLYHTKGFPNARVSIVEGNKTGDRGAIFLVNEGTKQKIFWTDFAGNTIVTDARLRTQIQSKQGLLWVFKGDVDPKQIEEDKERLTAYYRSLGFFRARLGYVKRANEAENWVRLTFVIDEGPRYAVRDVSIVGNTKFPTEDLAAELKLQSGDYFNQDRLSADLAALRDKYGSVGYVFADINADPRFLERPGELDLVYSIQEGKRCRVGKINVHIEGDYPHTRITTVLNRLSLHPGDIVDVRELRDSERRLRASGLFKVDPTIGVTPKIAFSPPGIEDAEEGETSVAGRPTGVRGQSPDPPYAPLYAADEPRAEPDDCVIDVNIEGQWADDPVAGQVSNLPGAPEPANIQQPSAAVPQAEPAYSVPQQPTQFYLPQSCVPQSYVPQPYVPQPLPQQLPPPQLMPEQPPTAPPTMIRGQSPPAEPSGWAPRWLPVPGQSVPQPTVQSSPASDHGLYAPAAPRASRWLAASGLDRPREPVVRAQYSAEPGYTTPQLPSTPPSATYWPSAVSPVEPPAAYVPPAVAAPAPLAASSAPAPGAMGAAPPAYVPPYPPSAQLPPPGSQTVPNLLGASEGMFEPGSPFLGGAPDDQLPLYVPLNPNVMETETGRLMFSVGVNSEAGLIGSVVVDEQNFDWRRWPTSWADIRNGTAFRGAGQHFRMEAVPGTQVQKYAVSFQEPYLLDTSVSLGLSGYYYTRIFREYDDQRLGGRVAWGYEFSPDLSGSVAVRAANINISDPIPGAPRQIASVVGNNALYGFEARLTHDTRDNAFLATEGHLFEIGVEEVVGSFQYPRADIDLRRYFMLHERPDGSGRHVLSLRSSAAVTGHDTPVYEHFYAGGFSTIRGFDFRGASPRVGRVVVGGHFTLLASAEYLFPITADDMLRGLVFCDTGTVEPSINDWSDDYRVSLGFGLRITIPAMGPAPIALDLAVPVAHEPGDEIENFSFFVGFLR